MKKIFFLLLLVTGIGMSANAQQYYLEKKANGVGPAGIPDSEWIKWPGDDCANQHDIDYGTVGMSKEQADNKFRNCLLDAGCPFVVAYMNCLRGETAQRAYYSAQEKARNTQLYKKAAEEQMGKPIDTYYYHILLR